MLVGHEFNFDNKPSLSVTMSMKTLFGRKHDSATIIFGEFLESRFVWRTVILILVL
jgi:hypothetical protein